MPEAKRWQKSKKNMKIKFNEIVEPKDVLSEGLNDIKGGSAGWWKDLLDSINLCLSGCSTGQRKPKPDETQSQPAPDASINNTGQPK
nr:hypothetical protein [uncultured Prevotella sp.]